MSEHQRMLDPVALLWLFEKTAYAKGSPLYLIQAYNPKFVTPRREIHLMEQIPINTLGHLLLQRRQKSLGLISVNETDGFETAVSQGLFLQ